MRELPWKVAAASVRGLSHEKANLPCQDAHRWVRLPGGMLAVAVADGAGSAPLASDGAALAAQSAIEFISQSGQLQRSPGQIPDEAWLAVLTDAIAAARTALLLEAKQRSLPAHDLATTLLLVVAGKDVVAGVQVGDGAIVAADASGKLRLVARSVPEEYLNETTFLTSEAALAKCRPEVWRGELVNLAVFSDGLQMVALRMPDMEPHARFFAPFFEFLRKQPDAAQANKALADFLTSPRLRERTDDDVTLVLAGLPG